MLIKEKGLLDLTPIVRPSPFEHPQTITNVKSKPEPNEVGRLESSKRYQEVLLLLYYRYKGFA